MQYNLQLLKVDVGDWYLLEANSGKWWKFSFEYLTQVTLARMNTAERLGAGISIDEMDFVSSFNDVRKSGR